MQGSKLTKYSLLGIAFLLGAIGLPFLSAGWGWFLIGIALCAFLAFCYLTLSTGSSSSPSIDSRQVSAPYLKEQSGGKIEEQESLRQKQLSSIATAPPELTKAPPTTREKAKKRLPSTKPFLPAYATPSRRYNGLFRPYSWQKERDSFAHFYYHGNNNETPETPFQRLADMARQEDWNYRDPEFQKKRENLPILTNYLNQTFLRLQEQKKIKLVGNRARACFNTGLLTPDNKDIFAVFRRNAKASKDNDRPDWWFENWFDSENDQISQFKPLPETATYIKEPADLFYDDSYRIKLKLKHIVDDDANHQRLPSQLQNKNMLAKDKIEDAAKETEKRCRRNYRIAIPGWYPKWQKVQLLLPLYLTSSERADLALVADKDTDSKTYIVRTALTLDMAYRHARLIARPDREWLNP